MNSNDKRWFSRKKFAALVVLMCVSMSLAANAAVEKRDGFYVVTLKGSPYEMGLEHGRMFKDEINTIYKKYLNDLIYENWVKQFTLIKGNSKVHANPRKAMAEFAQKTVEHIPAEYMEEIKGLAEGAGIDYREVLNMTVHVDFFSILMCSTMVASGQATPDGALVEARNLDWAGGGLRELDEYSTVFVVKPDTGHSFVSVMYPGIVGGLTAVNDAKLTVELNFVMTKDKQQSGFPALLMVRHVAQHASTLDEAEKLLRDMPRMAGYNITVVDGKTNEARTIEVGAGTVGTVNLSDRGTLVSTNHYLSKELASTNVTGKRPMGLPSTVRFDRLQELIGEKYGNIDVKTAMKMIHDDSVKVESTVQTVIFKPAERLMWVWARNRPAGDFVEFDVAKLLGGNQ